MTTSIRTTAAAALALASTGLLEWSLMILTSDHGTCFFHNATTGILISIVLRVFVFLFCFIGFQFALMPAYKNVKDRLDDRDARNRMARQAEPHPTMLVLAD